MILTFYGLDLRNSDENYRLVNFNHDYFESNQSLSALLYQSKNSYKIKEVVIALPDIQVWNGKASDEHLEKLLNLLTQHGLKIRAIDIESEAIFRALRHFRQINENCIVLFNINIDQKRIGGSVFLDHQKIFFYEEQYSHLMEETSHNKRQQIQYSLVNILHRFLNQFKIKYPNLNIEKYYLVGANQKTFNDENNMRWLLACGLSMWDEKNCQNLLPEKYKQQYEERKNMLKNIFKTILIGLLTISLFHAMLWGVMLLEKYKMKQYEKQIQLIEPKVRETEKANQQIISLNTQMQIFKKIQFRENQPIDFLNLLGHLMPEGVFLNTLNLQHNTVMLAGRAQTHAQIMKLMSHLQSHSFFQYPKLIKQHQDSDYPPYNFSFVIKMNVQLDSEIQSQEKKGENNE